MLLGGDPGVVDWNTKVLGEGGEENIPQRIDGKRGSGKNEKFTKKAGEDWGARWEANRPAIGEFFF